MYKITGTIYAKINSEWTKNPENLTDLEKEMILRTEQFLNHQVAVDLKQRFGLLIRVHFTDIEIMGSRAKLGDKKRKPTSEMLGCPFCGAIPTIEYWHGGRPTKRMVSCQNEDCKVQPQVTGETKKEAIANWNRRARYWLV